MPLGHWKEITFLLQVVGLNMIDAAVLAGRLEFATKGDRFACLRPMNRLWNQGLFELCGRFRFSDQARRAARALREDRRLLSCSRIVSAG